MSNITVIGRAWFRTRPWPIKAWVGACTIIGAVLGFVMGGWLAGPLLASLGP